MEQLSMFSSLDRHAKDSPSPVDALDWMTRAATSHCTPLEFAANLLQPGSSSRMSLACFPVGPVLRKIQQKWILSETKEPLCESSQSQVTSPSSFDGFRTSGILAH